MEIYRIVTGNLQFLNADLRPGVKDYERLKKMDEGKRTMEEEVP